MAYILHPLLNGENGEVVSTFVGQQIVSTNSKKGKKNLVSTRETSSLALRAKLRKKKIIPNKSYKVAAGL